ncbi:hypothetical protein FQR65_LT09644 [Abscondita terminalis]|nr:hypothetical protein FQR65_LT09644 [Abscondita terminalis]
MSLPRYTCYAILLTSYIILTKNTFLNLYRKLKRLPTITSSFFAEKNQKLTYHWFYQINIEGQLVWKPFSKLDSQRLEDVYLSTQPDPEILVSTDGGRYDVNLFYRKREPVYWTGDVYEVRRCSWFYKNYKDVDFIPFEEHIADILEDEYQNSCQQNTWRREIHLPNGNSIGFCGPDNIVLLPSKKSRCQRLIKRGINDEFDIKTDESEQVDHLIFAIHGIGAVCDLQLRTIEEVVDVFRDKVSGLLKINKSQDKEQKRVEILPINWHKSLHNPNSKTDKNLHSITLETLPLLRNFTNDTLVDILLYTSSIYSQDNEKQSTVKFSTDVPFAQIIIKTVTNELNRVYHIFKERNPNFRGKVSLLGHSLGSVIIFDLLCHQQPHKSTNQESRSQIGDTRASTSRQNTINLFPPITNNLDVKWPQLKFHPLFFFAVGSPIGLFLTVRGIDQLGTDFSLPTCKNFLNIFHPCDPIAYRIEPLVNDRLEDVEPFIVPYYGGKYFFIDLKHILTKLGQNISSSVLHYARAQLTIFLSALSGNNVEHESNNIDQSSFNDVENVSPGNLNKGRRIDYSLQENTIKYFNEYVCAVSSHACYWESPDVIQLLLKELYPKT